MGTNYYLKQEHLKCPTCGHNPEESLHIGKSSAGWCFSLHVHPEKGIHDLADWRPLIIAANRIEDEYGDRIEPVKMLEIIQCRHRISDGPNGLVRFKVDGRHCVKHGAGTWDCILGDFS